MFVLQQLHPSDNISVLDVLVYNFRQAIYGQQLAQQINLYEI